MLCCVGCVQVAVDVTGATFAATPRSIVQGRHGTVAM